MTLKPDAPDSEGHIALDARKTSKLGRDLQQEINDSVAATQRFFLSPLPDKLILTQQQFLSLQDYTTEMYQTEDRMFITPRNAMEIVIDREYRTDKDVEAVMQEVDKLKKEIHDHEETGDELSDGQR